MLTDNDINSCPDDGLGFSILKLLITQRPDLAGTQYLQINEVYTEP